MKALDVLMDQLKITGMDFQDIAAISGSGQVNYIQISYYFKKQPLVIAYLIVETLGSTN